MTDEKFAFVLSLGNNGRVDRIVFEGSTGNPIRWADVHNGVFWLTADEAEEARSQGLTVEDTSPPQVATTETSEPEDEERKEVK